MPAKSKNQQQAAGAALSAKRGEMDPAELRGAAKEMYESMSEKELKDFAETKHDGLPEKKSGITDSEAAYLKGFVEKCAEAGVDPEALAKGVKRAGASGDNK